MRVAIVALFGTACALFNVNEDVFSKPKFSVHYNKPITRKQCEQKIEAHEVSDPNNEKGWYHVVRGSPGGVASNSSDYLCFVPRYNDTNSSDMVELIDNSSEALDIVEKAFTSNRAANIVFSTCIYKTVTYWTYELCYNQSVRQFHQIYENGKFIEDPNAPKFVLSTFNKSTDVEVKEDFDTGSAFFLMQNLDGGTECDLTQSSRKLQIKYICDPTSKMKNERTPEIIMVRESKICEYVMVVSVPDLCKLDKFKTASVEPENRVQCDKIGEKEEEEIDQVLNFDDYDMLPLTYGVFVGIAGDEVSENAPELKTFPDVMIVNESGPKTIDEVDDEFTRKITDALIVNVRGADFVTTDPLFTEIRDKDISHYELVWDVYNFVGERLCAFYFIREGDQVRFQCVYEEGETEHNVMNYEGIGDFLEEEEEGDEESLEKEIKKILENMGDFQVEVDVKGFGEDQSEAEKEEKEENKKVKKVKKTKNNEQKKDTARDEL